MSLVMFLVLLTSFWIALIWRSGLPEQKVLKILI